MKGVTARRLRRLAAALAAAMIMAALALPGAAAEKKTVLRVAFPELDGYTMTAPDGSKYGLVVDFLDEIAKYTGWEYEYVPVENDRVIDSFLAGEFDLMGGTYYAEGFEQYFAYPSYHCGYNRLILLSRKDDHRVKSYDLSTLNGKTIGVFDRNLENIRRLQGYLQINDLDCTLHYYSYEDMDHENLYRYLESGAVDLLLGNISDVGGPFNAAVSFESQPHYIVTAPGNQAVLDGLDMALERIYEADPDFAKRAYEKNFPDASSGYVALNEREKAYVAQEGSVSVAVPREWHPMYCSASESHDGLVPDILAEVTKFSGLEFTYVFCDSYADAVERVRQGEADLLGFFMGTNEGAVERGFALSAPYIELDAILVRNKKSSYPAEGLVGAIQEGREMPTGLAADKIVTYVNPADALLDVNRGKVDFYYGISSHLEHVIQQENLTNVVQVNLINDSQKISFALPSPAQPELLTILNKTINHLTDEQKSAIGSRNIVSIGETHMTLSSIVYANPALAVTVVAAFLLLLLVVVILVAKSRLHAAAIRGELAKAEADSRAKSMFLSRMSHEIRTPINAIVGLTDLTEALEGLPDKARENLCKIKSSARYLLSLISDILDMSRIENDKMEIAREPFSLHETLDEIEDMMGPESAARRIAFTVERAFEDDVLLGDAVRLRQVLLNLLSNAFKFTRDGGRVQVRVAQEADRFTFRVADSGAGIAQDDQTRIFGRFEQVGSNMSKSQGTGLGLAISRRIVELMGGELKLQSRLGEGSTFYFTVELQKGEKADAPPPAQDAAPAAEGLRGARILLAEDNDLNAEIAVELLRMQSAAVVRAENGKIAVERFAQSAPDEFDAILMDIQMPEMDGLEAARAIRALARPDAPRVPIIAMTANAFKEDEEAARAAGMTGFVPKPIDVQRLYLQLHGALRRGGGE